MNVVLAIDQLVERDHTTYLLEILLTRYPEASIVTLAHKPGGVLGPLEMRPIQSSFLSRFVKTKADLWKYSFLIAGALKNLSFEPETQVIGVSAGFIQGLSQKLNTTFYLYSWKRPLSLKKSWLERPFEKYVNKQRLKSLSKKTIFSSQHLANSLNCPSAQVVFPALATEDFPLLEKPAHWSYDYFLVNVEETSEKQLEEIILFFKQYQEPVKLIGEDSHLKKLKEKYDQLTQPEKNPVLVQGEVEFWGSRCAGDRSLLYQRAKGLVDFSDMAFPLYPLEALVSGRPAFIHFRNQTFQELLGDHVHEQKVLSSDLFDCWQQGAEESRRRFALKFNGRLFKRNFGYVL